MTTMLPLDHLPNCQDLTTQACSERDLGLVQVWIKTFAPLSGSAAYVLRETLERDVEYIGCFRMYHHRYAQGRAQELYERFMVVLASHPEASRSRIELQEHRDGWTVDTVFRTGLQDEAVAVLQELVRALGLAEGLLRRAS